MAGSVPMRIRKVASYLETEESRQRRIRADTVSAEATRYLQPVGRANGDIEMTSL